MYEWMNEGRKERKKLNEEKNKWMKEGRKKGNPIYQPFRSGRIWHNVNF